MGNRSITWGSVYEADHDFSYDTPPEVLVAGADRYVAEAHYSFDVGFYPEVSTSGHAFDIDRPIAGSTILVVSEFVGKALIEHFHQHPQDLRRIDRRRFEELVAELFHGFGYDVELTSQTRDGGKDVVAIKRIDDISVKYLIECKRPDPGNIVPVCVVRELLGVRADEHATKAILVTTTRISAEAERLVERHKWELEAKVYVDIVRWLDDYIAMANGGITPACSRRRPMEP